MDEFHYYGEPERGWAWQVPLLELPQAQFLLMSATLGDVSELGDRPDPAQRARDRGRRRRRAAGAAVVHLVARPAARAARGDRDHRPGAGLRRALHPGRGRRARHLAAQRRLDPQARGDDRATGRDPLRRRLRQDPGQAAQARRRRAPRRHAARATAAWSSSSPRPASCRSSAAPTPSGSASTCRSAPCCSPGSRSSTAPASGCCAPASSSRSPVGPAGPASTPPATSWCRRPSTPSRTRRPRPRPRPRTPR